MIINRSNFKLFLQSFLTTNVRHRSRIDLKKETLTHKHPGLYLKRGLKRIEILEKSEHSFLRPSLPQQAISLLPLQTLHSSQSFSKTGLQSSRRSRQSIIVVLLEREIRTSSDAYNWSWPASLTSSFSPTGCTLDDAGFNNQSLDALARLHANTHGIRMRSSFMEWLRRLRWQALFCFPRSFCCPWWRSLKW